MKSVAHGKNGGHWLVPERVATNQEHYSSTRKPFTAVQCDAAGNPTGSGRMVVLRGDLYGLGTPGVGDMVVSSFHYKKKDVPA